MGKEITVGSLFDGIGGWLLAAKRAGLRPLWSSEIDPFPAFISHSHFPKVDQLGDITKIERLCSTRLVWKMRGESAGKYPSCFIWENVPGALSSNGGKDFRIVLEEILQTEIPDPASGRWANAGMVRTEQRAASWRVLDAQFWGVPQRRKRIFLIANLSGNDGTEILFEPQSLSGNLEENRKTEEENPGTSSGSHQGPGQDNRTLLMDIAHHDAAVRIQDGTAPTLTAHMGTGGLNVPVLYQKMTGTLLARDYKGLDTFDIEEDKCFVERDRQGLTIRKLTPLECERLQGLPDHWTAGGSDAKRYKAIGNGMAQPCADFVMRCAKEMICPVSWTMDP